MLEVQLDLNINVSIITTLISKIIIFDIDFYVISINAIVIIMISFTRLDFHDFTFSITRNASTKIVKKASFCLYSNSVSNFALRGKRTNIIVTLYINIVETVKSTT